MAGARMVPKVGIHDVAARAGVSIATVSRVLNQSRPVTPELRERVVSAAQELGYSANLLGRALRQGRSHSIGLLVPDLENPFFATLAQQVSRSFSRSNIDVFVYNNNMLKRWMGSQRRKNSSLPISLALFVYGHKSVEPSTSPCRKRDTFHTWNCCPYGIPYSSLIWQSHK